MQKAICAYFDGHRQALAVVEEQLSVAIEQAAGMLVETLHAGHKVLVMGNGGSAADAQHLAAELVGRFLQNRRALPAVALTTDSSILTAVGNDFGFDEIFSRQVEALAGPGDIVIGISTSGNSANVARGLEVASSLGCSTIALLGRDGGKIRQQVDFDLTVSADHTPHIQEGHAVIVHLLCQLVEEGLFPASKPKG